MHISSQTTTGYVVINIREWGKPHGLYHKGQSETLPLLNLNEHIASHTQSSKMDNKYSFSRKKNHVAPN